MSTKNMFKYLIKVKPLGLMYGSSGAFLSPENLVGHSRAKFPPDAATLSGLILSAKCYNNQNEDTLANKEFKENLYVAGPFWVAETFPKTLYIPMPWTKIIGGEKKDRDEWIIKDDKWCRNEDNREEKQEIKPDYNWLKINDWNRPVKNIVSNESMAKNPWEFVPMLHPHMKDDERHGREENGLFLENAVQIPEDISLIYLSTYSLESGWYKFGGENHVVEINSIEILKDDLIIKRLNQPIKKSFALITPAVFGSNRLSFRTPQTSDFPKIKLMLTDKAIPYRHRTQGRLSRGRYAVPAGSVYVLEEPLDKSWWEWPEEWFPNEGISLKKIGSGLCLPLDIKGLA